MMGHSSSKDKKQNEQFTETCRQQHVAEAITEEIVSPDDALQNVFNNLKLKRKRNVDKDLTTPSLMYTSTKEKYLIKLILEGNEISNKIIQHVVEDYCAQKSHIISESYGCSYGYILKIEDFLAHSLENCESFHQLNKDLKCYHGRLYYPVDIMWNPFCEWKPGSIVKETASDTRIYETILNKWPTYRMFGNVDDMLVFTSHQERYLIKIINDGKIIPNEIVSHVVEGCENKAHLLSNEYGCCYGFILTRAEFDSHVYKVKKTAKGLQLGRIYGPDGKPTRNPQKENFPNCQIKHSINDRMECHFGVLCYSRQQSQESCANFQSRRKEECNFLYSKNESVQAVYKRIKWKHAHNWKVSQYYTWFKNMRSWEKYMIALIKKGENLSIEVISHVLDGDNGCYIGAHMLDEKYGCCCGFILKVDEFISHNFDTCKSHHVLNDELRCENGSVYHVSAPWECPSSDLPHLGGTPVSAERIKGLIPQDNRPVARPPPEPAPPPPDLIDQ